MNHVAPQGDVYEQNFGIGLRSVLSRALTMPRDTDYYQVFGEEEKRLCDLRWFYRGDRGAARRATFLAQYPEEDGDGISDERWGQLAGKHAAVRWLIEEDRECADRYFPFLDT